MRGGTDEKERCLEKLNEMQTFLPFLDFMIDKIKKKHVLPLECQLSKFQHIRSLIVEKNGRYSLEGLTNIEDVLQKLINKLDYKGVIPKHRKDLPGVTVKSTSREAHSKTDYESAELPNCSISVTTNSSSNAFALSVSDSSTGTVDILTESLRMSVGHSSRNDDDKPDGPEYYNDSSATEFAANIGSPKLDCVGRKESENYRKVVGRISSEVVDNVNNSVASDVLANSRKKLLKSVSGKGIVNDNCELGFKTFVRHDSSMHKVERVQDSKRRNSDHDCSGEKEKFPSLNTDFLSNAFSDISDDEYVVEEDNTSGIKYKNENDSDTLKNRHFRNDNYCPEGDAVNKTEFKYNDNFIISAQSNSVCEFSSKQKLRERLSADIAEVHKVPGKSVGGSLRSLKDVKTSSQESESVKSDKVKESHSNDSRKPSKERNDHRRGSHENKYSHQKRDSNVGDLKSDRKEGSRDKSRERRKHRKHESDPKNKKESSHSSSERSSRKSSSSKGKNEREKKGSEIDKLNDQELAAFVKENISSFPNLSKLRPEELRKIARSSLSTENLKFEKKRGAEELQEFAEEKKIVDQDLNRKSIKGAKGNNDSSNYSPPQSDERKSQVNSETNSMHLTSVKETGKQLLQTDVRVEGEISETLIDESVFNPSIRLSSVQGELESSRSVPDPRTHEEFSDLDCKDQRPKHQSASMTDNGYTVNDTKTSNWLPLPEISQTENQATPRFSNVYNERSNCDSRTWNVNVNIINEKPYSKRPYFPVQGNNRFHKFDSGSYDASTSTQKNYGTVSEVSRFSGYNAGRNSNLSMPEPKSYGEYKQLKRQEKEIMNKSRIAHRDLPTSVEQPTSEEEFSENKSKLSVSFIGSNPVEEDGKGKDSSKLLVPDKVNDYRGNKLHGLKTVPLKSSSKFRKSLDGDKGVKVEKSSGSKPPSVDDELISPLEKLYDNDPKLVTGRGYGLQNFKIPKKVKSTSNNNQKSHFDNKDPKIKQCSSSQDKFDTEADGKKVGFDNENPSVNGKSDHSKGVLTSTDVETIPELYSSTKNVTDEEDMQKNNLNIKNIVADGGDSNSSNKDDEKCQIINEEGISNLEILPREEIVDDSEPKNIVQLEDPEGTLFQSSENNFNQKKSEPEVKQDSLQSQKSYVTNVDPEDLPKSTTGDNDGKFTILENKESEEKAKWDSDIGNKSSITEEITQELVEALIRKSFESGEGELLLAKAKLFKELALKLNSKKLRTIQKIINSESDSSSSLSESSTLSEKKKKKTKKKKSTDDTREKFTTKTNKQKKRSAKTKDCIDSSGDENSGKSENSIVSSDKTDSTVSYTGLENIEKEVEGPPKNSKASNRKTKLLEQIFSESPSKDQSASGTTNQTCDKEPDQKTKVKVKSKGKTELDRLHEDIRSMFITSGVVTATGQRMCRILRESGGKMNNLDLVKESAKMVEEEKLASRRSGRRNLPLKTENRHQSPDRRTLRDRSKNRNQLQPEVAKLPSDEKSKRLDVNTSKLLTIANHDQPKVVLQRIDLKKLSYAYRIGGLPQSYTRKRGMNVAKRGRSLRSSARSEREREIFLNKESKVYLSRNIKKYFALRDTTVRTGYKPKRLMDIVQNLPLKLGKLRHLNICGKDEQKYEKVSLSQLLRSDTEQKENKKNMLKDSEILNYAFELNKSIFVCLLCDHTTKAITDHYLEKHPESEVLISRIAISEAEKAIRDSEANNYDVTTLEQVCTSELIKGRVKSKLAGTPGYLCRMCKHGSIATIWQFFNHVSTHTGEYRFKCPIEGCSLPMANRGNVKMHMTWKHPKNKHEANKAIELFPVPRDTGVLFGYLCSRCNFVQLLRKNVEAHIERQHVDIEDVRIIKIDMSRKPKERTCKKRRENKKRKISSDNEDTSGKTSGQNEYGGDEDDGDEAVSTYNNNVEDSSSHQSEGLIHDDDEHRTSATRLSESDSEKKLAQKQGKNDGVKKGEHSSICNEKVITEERDSQNVLEERALSSVSSRLDITADEMQLENCADVTYGTNEDETMEKELVEEFMLKKEISEDSDVMISDERINTETENLWEVGPLKAVMFNSEIVSYKCTLSGCRFSTEMFTCLKSHICSSHSLDTWSGVCKKCTDFPERKVKGLEGTVGIYKILEHMESHIKIDAGENTIKKLKTENVVNDDNKILETGEAEEIKLMRTKSKTKDVPFPVKPLLRVRSFVGDRLSKPKCLPDDDHSYSESPRTVSDTLGDEDKDTTEVLFTIKDVRSLNTEAKDEPSPESNVFASQEISVKNFPPNAEVISGKPVLIRSCPSPKITIRSETNAIPIPVAQAKQAVEAGHLKVVPPPTEVAPIGLKKIDFVTTASIRILSPATFTSQTVLVPTFTTSTRLVPISKPTDTVVVMSQSKSRTLAPVVKKTSLGPGLLIKDVKITKTDDEANNAKKKKKKAITPPLISITKPLLSSAPGESSQESNQITSKRQQLYSLSFGGKNIKDVKIYQEMLTKKKLCQLFKCMAVECSFTCNSDTIFTQHIGLHEAQQRIKGKKRPQSKIKKLFNWQQCAYCCEVLVHTGSALSQHILTEHGHCLYQCAYCFYRAVSEAYVDLHQNTVHDKLLKEKKKLIYKCQPVPGAIMSKQFEKQIRPHNVKPYHCEICGNKFFIIKHFFDHLTKQHLSVTAYTCHICKILCFKADRLIAHYKLHSYSMFQCSYCLHGTETQKEMLFHLCNFHFSQPPILYARMLEDTTKGDNIVLDDLKLITFENLPSDPERTLEEVETGEYDVDTEAIEPVPISVDLSAIVSELGIDVEDGSKRSTPPLEQVMMEVESDLSHSISVESILPNAKFSSDADNLCEENSSVIVASESKAGHPKTDDASVPIGQLPIEILKLNTREQSSACRKKSDSDNLPSLEEGLEKLQQNNCQIIVSPAADKKSTDEIPTRSMHKLPPTIPINRSGVNNVYQPKKNVSKKLGNGTGQVKENASVLLKHLGVKQRISSDCIPSQSVIVTYPIRDDKSAQKKENSTLIPSIQNVVTLKRQGSSCDSEDSLNNLSGSNPVKRLRMSSGPVNSVITINPSRDSPLMISDVRSLSVENTALQPPIIRVEDFANDEKGNLVRKSDSLTIEQKKNSNDSDKTGDTTNENSKNYLEAPLSPEVIIIDQEDGEKNMPRELIEVVDSEDEVETNESSDNQDKEKQKLEGGNDVEIRKQMERLRNQIENETDCLLLDDTAHENDPLACSEKSENSKVCFSADAEIMQSFNEDRASEDVGSTVLKDKSDKKNTERPAKVADQPEKVPEKLEKVTEGPEKISENREKVTEAPENVTERSEKVIEENKDKGNEISSEKGKEDAGQMEMQKKLDTRTRTNHVEKYIKVDCFKPKDLTGKDLYLCGIANCRFAADNCKELKDHVCVCDFSRDSHVLSCPHCSRQFKHSISYVDHLKVHGEKRYGCGLCAFCSAVETNVARHIKQKHKCSQTKTLPNDSFKPGHFVMYPKNYKVEKRSGIMNLYSPGDEDKLPLQSIYQENVKCAKCPYFTKVRSNMVRHLKIHIKSVEAEGSIVVPSTAPTNPVPCLDTKERMFDKMANLAASSQLAHANKEKMETLSPEEEAKLPQYVAEQMRHKCCSPDCNYLTIDDNMLKHHIKALHDEINVYSCPHCRDTVHVEFRFVPLDKIGQHLKYHDSKLYKCCHCLYFHHQKHIVEKHVFEKHPERRFFVYTVREPKLESASEEEHSSPVESIMKVWKCGLCDAFERTLRSEVVEHLAKVHNTKSKFKCKYCDMKSSQYSIFAQHFASKHNGQKVECLRSIVQVNRTCSEKSQGAASQDSSTEYFDTTPLWQRDAPRIRHIRGILIEEEEIKTKRTKKRISDIENEVIPPPHFPMDSFYCPLCTDKKKLFRTKSAEIFRNHLYQELNYQQFACTLCGKMFVDKKDYERHHLRFHPNRTQGIKQTKEDSEIKFWVDKVVFKQEAQIKERKRRMILEGVMQLSKKKKMQLEEDEEVAKEKIEGNTSKAGSVDSKLDTKVKTRASGEKSDFVRCTRSGSSGQMDELPKKSTNSNNEKIEQETQAQQECMWPCHYCKDSFQTEKEVVKHCRNNHANNPVNTVLLPDGEGVVVKDDFWLIEYGGNYENKDSEKSCRKDGEELTEKNAKSNVYSCGYCMIEVTDQTSIVNHFETHHKTSNSMAQTGMIGTIYYRCNVCSEKLITFNSLNIHAKDYHPNMTLQFEIRKIYKYDTGAKETEAAKSSLDKAKDGSYQCPRCPVISSSYLDCIDHFNEHYPRYACGKCNVRFYTVQEMENHQEESRHTVPYAMTIPSEKMLDEYKAGITVKKNGVWLSLEDSKRSEGGNDGPDTKRQKIATARKSTTQVPERRSHGDETSGGKVKSTASH